MRAELFDHLLDDSHRTFREVCRRFVREEIAPHVWEWEEAEAFPKELFRKAGAAGLLGTSFPEAYGGGGGDWFHALVMSEELIRGGSAGIASGLGTQAIALPPILHLGTEEQKQRYVPAVLAGDKVAALAITEPGAGSDVAGVHTRAVRDGDHYLITGAKTFITSGVKADIVSVLTRTSDDPHQGLTFFVVERGMPGFEVSRALKKTGWRASDTAELSFDGVRVPLENRIGPEGSGFLALMHNFEGERLLLAIQGHALAETALEEAARYAKERHAFGRPIGKFQVIRHKLAEMATQVTSAKVLNYAIADAMRRGQPVMVEVCMAKNHAAKVAREVCWEAVQIFGGMGYMRETVVERLARDARLLPIGGGTNEIMNEVIARGLGY
ncbi:MAG: acyl-CoA dehydrogenase family protein [Deltaproteobacteria bacterium]|nr:acyl-CoA dehydrogenase family protein [Deltaproteobacteria bacterium]MBW2256414.1 acyl-CoA dehydrogenase family protein [Deltaproteobacteria bacterium]